MRARSLLVLVLSCAAVLAPGPSFGQYGGANRSGARTMPDASKSGNLEQQLIKLNEEMLAAQVRADVAKLDQMLTGDYTRLHAVGALQSRAEFLDDLRKDPGHFVAIDVSDVNVRVYGTTAILIGHAVVKRAGDPDDKITFLDVWVQEGGKWLVATWVTSRIPQRAAGPAEGK